MRHPYCKILALIVVTLSYETQPLRALGSNGLPVCCLFAIIPMIPPLASASRPPTTPPRASPSHPVTVPPFLKVLLLSLPLYALYLLLFSLQDALDLFATLVVSLRLNPQAVLSVLPKFFFSTCVSFAPYCSF